VSEETVSRYHAVRATAVMALGVLAVLTGLLFLAMLGVRALRDEGRVWEVLWWVLVAVGVLLVLGLLRTLWRVLRPPVALTLDDEGYRATALVGAGTMAGHWKDVVRVESVERSGDVGVVVHLRDGRTSRIVARLLAEPMATLLADLDVRLNRAHGRRRP
jgi:hypothetical protein